MHCLVIDDHVGLAVGASRRDPVVRELETMFDNGTIACTNAKLPQHAGKRVRGVTTGVALGAELLDGKRIGAERVRRAYLGLISLLVAKVGRASGHLLRKLFSSWTFCCLFRRPTMCMLGSCFKELPPVADDHFTYAIPKASREELVMLSCMGPHMLTHLDAIHSSHLVCTDASDVCMGAVETLIDPTLHKELWRHRERRGWTTHLVGKAGEHILACAPGHEVSDFAGELVASWETRDADKIGGPQRTLIERWDYLELCCGKNAPLITSCSRAGLRCGPKIDLLLHSIWDVKSGRLIEWIIFLVENGRVYYIHSGAPCTTFSIARCPKDRSKDQPYGKDTSLEPIAAGNLMLLRTMVVHFVVYLVGLKVGDRFTVSSHEHPASAFSWWLPPVINLFMHEYCGKVTMSWCQFGAPYRKHTTFGYIYTLVIWNNFATASVEEVIRTSRSRAL